MSGVFKQPTHSHSFKENFWDKEIGEFSSFEILNKKIKDRQKSMKDYLEFLKQRIATQDSYGKSLSKLGKQAAGKSETGVMQVVWQNALQHAELPSSSLVQCTAEMDAELNKVLLIAARQREQRKREENEVRSLQSALKTALSRVDTRTKSLNAKCREKEQARVALEQLDSPKAQRQMQQVTQQFEAATASLHQAEAQLNEARCSWEKRTIECYEVFEALEEQRLESTMHLMNTLHKLDRNRLDQEQKHMKELQVLTSDDLTAEMVYFVTKNATGNERPVSNSGVSDDEFEDNEDEVEDPLYDTVSPTHRQQKQHKKAHFSPPSPPTGCGGNAPAASPSSGINKASLQQNLDTVKSKLKTFLNTLPKNREKMYTAVLECNRSSASSATTAPKDDSEGEEEEERMFNNDMYCSVGFKDENEEVEGAEIGQQGVYRSGAQLMRVTFKYEAKHESDVSIEADEIVTAIRVVNEEWTEVKAPCGNIGFFPSAFLEPAS